MDVLKAELILCFWSNGVFKIALKLENYVNDESKYYMFMLSDATWCTAHEAYHFHRHSKCRMSMFRRNIHNKKSERPSSHR